MANCSEQMMAMMQKVKVHWQQLIDVEKERNALQVLKEENKILQINPMSVEESVRAYLIYEQQGFGEKEQRARTAWTGVLVNLASYSVELPHLGPAF